MTLGNFKVDTYKMEGWGNVFGIIVIFSVNWWLNLIPLLPNVVFVIGTLD